MNLKRKLVALLLSAVVACGLVPSLAFAAIGDIPSGETPIGQVHVSISDTLARPAGVNYPAPRGTIAEGDVDLYSSDSAMSAIVRLANEKGVAVVGADKGYITSVAGLGEFDCGKKSGWMGTIDDWFANTGFSSVTVSSGVLEPGSEVDLMYTLDGGPDLGSDWGSNDKTVASLSVGAGILSPSFSADVHSYTLTLPEGSTSVALTPTATNKNFQVKARVGGTWYKRGAEIPISDGSVIEIVCGDPSWPTMNDAANVPAQRYEITVQVGSSGSAPVFSDVDYSDWYGDAVTFVAARGLITGYTDGNKAGLFGVSDTLTRGQLATILWRNACPDEYASYDPKTAKNEIDIAGSADGMYYTAAANWAFANGVITGIVLEDGTRDFAAEGKVSFEQLVTVLARLCAAPGELESGGSDLSAFADGDLASGWSRSAFAWAAKKGLVEGYDWPTGKYLVPGEDVARERVAVVLKRAFEMGIM